jgi:hypothetical protein
MLIAPHCDCAGKGRERWQSDLPEEAGSERLRRRWTNGDVGTADAEAREWAEASAKEDTMRMSLRGRTSKVTGDRRPKAGGSRQAQLAGRPVDRSVRRHAETPPDKLARLGGSCW